VKKHRSISSVVNDLREEEAARLRRLEEEDHRLIAMAESDAAGALLAD
jgi:hypothetical protein